MLKDFLASYPTEEKEEIPKRLSLLLLLLAKKKKRKFSFSRLGLEGGGKSPSAEEGGAISMDLPNLCQFYYRKVKYGSERRKEGGKGGRRRFLTQAFFAWGFFFHPEDGFSASPGAPLSSLLRCHPTLRGFPLHPLVVAVVPGIVLFLPLSISKTNFFSPLPPLPPLFCFFNEKLFLRAASAPKEKGERERREIDA